MIRVTDSTFFNFPSSSLKPACTSGREGSVLACALKGVVFYKIELMP